MPSFDEDPESLLESLSNASLDDASSFLRLAAHVPGARPAVVERDRTGEQIGPFLIQRKVGQGGMGVVYEAKGAEGGERVALKLLPVSTLTDATYERRFLAEAEALASLDHPNIVRHVAHGTSPAGEPYLAMEWLDGEDLGKKLARSGGAGLPIAECVVIGRAVSSALSAAHARGIVHRDIKPSNIFLSGGRADRVKVLDFGIARLSRAPQTFTATGAVIGTPGYMAPEQARGERTLDLRADLFSLGAVLFECLAGRPAFLGSQPMAILAKLLLEEPRLAELRPDLPAELTSLVQSLLMKDPASRPQSAAEVERALAAAGDRLSAGLLSIDPAGQTLFAEPSRESTGRGKSARMEAEKRFLFLVAARMDEAAAAAMSTESQSDGLATYERARQEGAALGVRVVELVDGSLLATLPSDKNSMDQAARAARFALLLRSIAPALSIALVTGQAEPSDSMPVGAIVDRAAELLRASRRGIWLDDTSAALLDARFEIAGAPPELLGEFELGEGVRRLLGRPSPCVGRERELRALGDILRECMDEGVARPVLVTAAAGAGKSRLRHELVKSILLRGDGVTVWLGRGDPMRAGSAYALIASVLSSAAGLHAGEPIEARRDKIERFVAQRVRGDSAARISAFLGEICGAPFDASAAPRLEEARKSRAVMVEEIQRAWEDFIVAACEVSVLLLVLEDVHWADAASLKLVDAALDKAREQPWMVLAFSRPEVHDLFPRLWSERGVQEIRLPELTRRAAEKLVRHALGDGVDPAQVARIVERAGGHAFYLEELIRAVAAGQRDALPETVLAMVQSRLDGLGADARRVLRAASVFGETFWQGGVLALLGGGDVERQDVRRVMDQLVEREIFTRYRGEGRFPGEAQLAFRHALLRDGAHAMLAEDDLTAGHRLAASWLEQAGEDDPMVLAEHFDRGGEPLKAAKHYLRAGERALLVGDHVTAAARAERGLACGAEGELQMDLLRVMGESRALLGEWAGAIPLADEVLRTTPPGSRAYSSALMGKTVMAMQLGHPDFMTDVLARAQDLVITPDNAALLSQVFSVLFVVLLMMEQNDLAEHYYQRFEEAAAVARPDDPEGASRILWARLLRTLQWDEDPFTALRVVSEACSEGELGKTLSFGHALHTQVAAVYRYLGDHARAEQLIAPYFGGAGRDPHARAIARSHLAQSLIDRGRHEEASVHGRKLVAEGRELNDLSREQWGHATLARAHLQAGRPAEAEAEALEALSMNVPIPAILAELRALVAAARLAQGRTDEALAPARESARVLDSMKARPMASPFIRLTLAEVLWAAGERDASREALRVARERLLAVAEKILDESLKRSFLEGVAVHARTLALARERLDSNTGG